LYLKKSKQALDLRRVRQVKNVNEFEDKIENVFNWNKEFLLKTCRHISYLQIKDIKTKGL